MTTLHIPQWLIRKRKSWTIIGLDLNVWINLYSWEALERILPYERAATHQREVEHILYPLGYRIDQLLKLYSTELHIYGVDEKMQHSNNLVLFIMLITFESKSRMVICIYVCTSIYNYFIIWLFLYFLCNCSNKIMHTDFEWFLTN